MFKELYNSFIPSATNDYRPYFLRAWPVATLLVVIVGLYGAATWTEHTLTTRGSNLAAVVSAVLVDLANADRAQNDLHTLAVNPTLQQVAQMKANDMAAKGYFAHTSPEGKTPWYWFQQAEYKFSYAGENLAVYFSDSADVERAWMQSPGHRANLLSPHFTEIGIATAEGVYQGQATTFVVQEFGAPVADTPAPRMVATSTAKVPHKVSTTTAAHVAVVKGAATSTPDALTVIHEDPQFIAVKSASTTAAPSAYPAATQSTLIERMLTSPKTMLAYGYGALAVLVVLALIFLVVFEIRKQRPMNIMYAVLIIVLLVILLGLSQSQVVVASAASMTP